MNRDPLHSFFKFLETRLKKDLPGKRAQFKMAPKPEKPEDYYLNPPEDSRPSSVLMPLFLNRELELSIILTLRPDHLAHGGQISFPGGGIEIGETAKQAAMRETCEEIGIHSNNIDIAGKLTPLYLRRTNNFIEPFVGKLTTDPDLSITNREVEEVIPIAVDSLLDKKYFKREPWTLDNGTKMDVPYWTIHNVPLWGATAMMLNELLELYIEYLEN